MPFAVDLENISFFLTWAALGSAKDEHSIWSLQRGPSVRQSSRRCPRMRDVFINLRDPPPCRSARRSTPIQEAFYSPKYGLASPFSHYFLDWRPKKKMGSVYVYWENTSGNWVSGRGNSCIVDDILLLQKSYLLPRILVKMSWKGVYFKYAIIVNNRNYWISHHLV